MPCMLETLGDLLRGRASQQNDIMEVADTPSPQPEAARIHLRGLENVGAARELGVTVAADPNSTLLKSHSHVTTTVAVPVPADETQACAMSVKRRMARYHAHGSFKPTNTLGGNRHQRKGNFAKKGEMFDSVPYEKRVHEEKVTVATDRLQTLNQLASKDEQAEGRPYLKRRKVGYATAVPVDDEEQIKYEQADDEDCVATSTRPTHVEGLSASRSSSSGDGSILPQIKKLPVFDNGICQRSDRYLEATSKLNPVTMGTPQRVSALRSQPTLDRSTSTPKKNSGTLAMKSNGVIEILDDDDTQAQLRGKDIRADFTAIGSEVAVPRLLKDTRKSAERVSPLRHADKIGSAEATNLVGLRTAVASMSSPHSSTQKVDSSAPRMDIIQTHSPRAPDEDCNHKERSRSAWSSKHDIKNITPHKRKIPNDRRTLDGTRPFRADQDGNQRIAFSEESEDEDELQGGNTLGHRARKGPYSEQTLAVRSKRLCNTPRAPQHEDTSGSLKRTAFRSSYTAEMKECHSDLIEIPICSITSRGCMIQQPTALTMVFNPTEQVFHVESNSTAQRLPGKNKLFTIGCIEAQQFHTGPESPKVQLKGSATENSNGSILIEFVSHDGVTLMRDLLAANNLRVLEKTAIHMNKVFENCASGISKDHLMQMKHPGMEPDEEMIIYERRRIGRRDRAQNPLTAEDERRTTRFSKLDSPTSQDPGSDATHNSQIAAKDPILSPYFDARLRRSSRQNKAAKRSSPSPPAEKRWTKENKPDRWKHSVVFPSEGTRRVTVDFEDLERLDEGEFFNDNIISFALRRIEESMSPTLAEGVHFFNTFFYSALTSKAGKGSINYDAVRRWTKNADLFRYPFVVIPVNINLHWFVLIVTNLPNIERQLAGGDDHNTRPTSDHVEAMRDLSINEDSEPHTGDEMPSMVDVKMKIGSPSSISADSDAPVSDKTACQHNKNRKRKRRPIKKIPLEKPSIISLDSFGSMHFVEIKKIKLYLSEEAIEKRGMIINPDDPNQLGGVTAKGIPEQTNFCDCGVYLIAYIEEFAKNPRNFVNKILSREMDSLQDFAHFNPAEKRAELRNALLQLHKEQEAERAAQMQQKQASKSQRSHQTFDLTDPHKDLLGLAAITGLDPKRSDTLVKPRQAASPPSSPKFTLPNPYTNAPASESGGELEATVPRALHDPPRHSPETLTTN